MRLFVNQFPVCFNKFSLFLLHSMDNLCISVHLLVGNLSISKARLIFLVRDFVLAKVIFLPRQWNNFRKFSSKLLPRLHAQPLIWQLPAEVFKAFSVFYYSYVLDQGRVSPVLFSRPPWWHIKFNGVGLGYHIATLQVKKEQKISFFEVNLVPQSDCLRFAKVLKFQNSGE